MSQRGSGKRWLKVTAFPFLVISLASCSVAQLERFARDNEPANASVAGPTTPTSP